MLGAYGFELRVKVLQGEWDFVFARLRCGVGVELGVIVQQILRFEEQVGKGFQVLEQIGFAAQPGAQVIASRGTRYFSPCFIRVFRGHLDMNVYHPPISLTLETLGDKTLYVLVTEVE